MGTVYGRGTYSSGDKNGDLFPGRGNTEEVSNGSFYRDSTNEGFQGCTVSQCTGKHHLKGRFQVHGSFKRLSWIKRWADRL